MYVIYYYVKIEQDLKFTWISGRFFYYM